ncbi:MAG: DNA-directed RNA polymerase subunit omega [Candidatus Omnitrophota bacterium]
MKEVSVQDLVKKVGSIYKLVVLASRRTVELTNGAVPLVEKLNHIEFADLALQEIAQGKITLKLSK